MYYSPEVEWYVLRIRSKYHQLTEQALTKKQFEVLNPTFQESSKRKDRKKLLIKPIFNGYMFLQAQLNAELHLEILKSYGVTEFLKTERGPTPVPQEQIDNICLLEKHIGELLLLPEFAVGNWVQVTQGPLEGLVGQIDQADRKYLKISVSAIPGSIAIEVSPEYVKSLDETELYALKENR